MRHFFLFAAICALGFWGCADTQKVPSGAARAQIEVPSGQTPVLKANAKGAQVYQCAANASGAFQWKLKGPDAALYDDQGQVIAKHYAGPTWESNDGSKVVASAVGQTPSPDAKAVAWLLLQVKSHQGDGVLSKVTYIQRVNTSGGKPGQPDCEAAQSGAEERVSYTAQYIFYAPAS